MRRALPHLQPTSKRENLAFFRVDRGSAGRALGVKRGVVGAAHRPELTLGH